MSAGFRKSLFGFNCDDVMEYVEKTHKDFVQKETVLNEQLDVLNASLNDAKDKIGEILKEKDELAEQLKVYTDKYDEIERLSQNIGKLYLVAESNSKSVMGLAEENRAIANEEVCKNIACIDDTQITLLDLKNEINKTANEFTAKLQTLLISLDNAKMSLNGNNFVASEKIDEYKELLDSIKA